MFLPPPLVLSIGLEFTGRLKLEEMARSGSIAGGDEPSSRVPFDVEREGSLPVVDKGHGPPTQDVALWRRSRTRGRPHDRDASRPEGSGQMIQS